LIRAASGVALTSGLLAAAVAVVPSLRSTADGSDARTALVRRADFDAVVVAAGRVESARNTEIRCTLERLTSGGNATILNLVDDGTVVKAGQVLCEIDSSEYVELVRRQTIVVDQARAAYQQAELDYEVSKIGLDAYRLGEMAQTDKLYRGQIALAKSDLTRQNDRLAWSRRMLAKGYFAVGQVVTEELTLDRAKLSLAQTETAFENFLKFTVPKSLRALESVVIGSKATLDFQAIKLKREEDRLALYREMVERCTVRAPHDGFVLHANRPGRTPEVFEGATVRQRQRLFTLPDLSQMVVDALLHETVVNRIKPGMRTKVRIEALPGRSYNGVVQSVAPMPYNERKAESGSDVTYFLARVQLTSSVEGLRPGMTAELDILADRREKVVAVPPDAVNSEGGKDVCYVRHDDRLERRPVRLGRSSHDLVEVLDGLSEGERVVLHVPAPAEPSARRSSSEFGGAWDLSTFPPPAVPAPRGGMSKAGREGRGEGRAGREGRPKGARGARKKGAAQAPEDAPPGF
jgi:HlyD family secretion protein